MHERFKNVLAAIPYNIALTADGWSSRTLRGYSVVTVHCINDSWVFKSAVLEFAYFPRPRNTGTISSLLLHILYSFGISSKMASITTDSGE